MHSEQLKDETSMMTNANSVAEERDVQLDLSTKGVNIWFKVCMFYPWNCVSRMDFNGLEGLTGLKFLVSDIGGTCLLQQQVPVIFILHKAG